MVTEIKVSRYYEPVPQMGIEARYVFTWYSNEFEKVKLSQRRNRESKPNSQFGKVEDIALSDVPDDIVKEAQDKLKSYSDELADVNKRNSDD